MEPKRIIMGKQKMLWLARSYARIHLTVGGLTGIRMGNAISRQSRVKREKTQKVSLGLRIAMKVINRMTSTL